MNDNLEMMIKVQFATRESIDYPNKNKNKIKQSSKSLVLSFNKNMYFL